MPTVPESHQDLLQANVGVLATNGQDGFPQVTALWFLLDDDGIIKFSLNDSRQKVKNLLAHPECSFFVLDTNNPYRTLEIRGRAIVTPDTDHVLAKKVIAKYGGYDFTTTDRPGETRMVVSLEPLKVNTWGK